MLTPEGPKILEYNCRLGDPETEAILLRADFDFADACVHAVRGDLRNFAAHWTPGASVCVVIASEGYPGNPLTGRPILGLPSTVQGQGSVVFHAGTSGEKGRYYTNGGRFLVVAASGTDLEAARKKVYESVRAIKCEGSFYQNRYRRERTGKSSSPHHRKIRQLKFIRERSALNQIGGKASTRRNSDWF